MKQDIKERWVAALRSGEYTQGQYRLEQQETGQSPKTSFCCMGVLCDLAIKDGVVQRTTQTVPGGTLHFIHYDGEEEIPPPSVMHWADLRTGNLSLDHLYHDGTTSKVRMETLNDDFALGFNEIADMIEAQL